MMRPRPEPPVMRVRFSDSLVARLYSSEPPVTTATSPLTSYRSCLLNFGVAAISICGRNWENREMTVK
jgi:hypothetical protein